MKNTQPLKMARIQNGGSRYKNGRNAVMISPLIYVHGSATIWVCAPTTPSSQNLVYPSSQQEDVKQPDASLL
jgi:hypothetical protein